MNDIYIVSGSRTPMGAFQGSLTSMTAVELGAAAISESISRAGIEPDSVDEVIMGNVLSAGLRQGPARQAAMDAGIPVGIGATTINKLCGSGMKAAMLSHDLISAGTNDVMVAGGMESMTNAPYLIAKARGGMRMGHGEIQDSMFTDGLEDAKSGRSMGEFAQEMADRYQFTREDMDNYAIASLTRAQTAIKAGKLLPETAKITVADRKKGDIEVKDDEQPFNANIDKIPSLRPAFKSDGTVTAANSSSISDGASALVLASEEAVKQHGLKPVARIVGHATNSRDPSEFTIAPVGAIEKLLAKTGWDKSDVDLFEINEAFAMVTMAAIKDLDLDPALVNIHGGACAQGHPIGSTGSRIIVSLMYALKEMGKQRGIAALCIGGGEATAVAIELTD
ncbi:MAG: acetyl-CoA C-acyltransferase [OM182 bacterium MED-G24]|uniref:Acetyl-CoA C-acyltransferase n=1 Tax=OM182 bacterium MED-G24 TaxID=1986255 RepID=A0A2A5WPL8_9GAMM|nr:MAG: acetyl-CoA C-acyltransferase [OM182 bacterium MED-G24]|tara:strand:+ start:2304 stop:3485 length:1182 start_codon:yes stop_codon:yes gene_type:complete